MVLYADPTYDNRVLREAASLAAVGHRVTIASPYPPRRPLAELPPTVRILVEPVHRDGAAPGGAKPFEPLDGQRPAHGSGRRGRVMAMARRLSWTVDYARGLRGWGATVRRSVPDTDIWHAHDLTGLIAITSRVAKLPERVVYDSHELYLESGAAGRSMVIRRPLGAYERRLARDASVVLTTSRSLAAELERRHGVAPVVVMNAPPRPTAPAVGVARRHYGLGTRPICVYHGSLQPRRGLEAFLRARELLPPEVVFLVIGEGPLADRVRAIAAGPGDDRRVVWHPLVPPSELRGWLADADVGLVMNEPDRLNHVLAVPNKLGELLNAGVPILASDFPELHRILDETGAGEVCDPMDPRSVAEGVRRLLEPARAATMRRRALDAAQGAYNWETQERALLGAYAELLRGGRA